MNLFTKQKQTQRHRIQIYSYKGRGYKLGIWDQQIQTMYGIWDQQIQTMYKTDEQGPTA